jgi:hypothetical protein
LALGRVALKGSSDDKRQHAGYGSGLHGPELLKYICDRHGEIVLKFPVFPVFLYTRESL